MSLVGHHHGYYDFAGLSNATRNARMRKKSKCKSNWKPLHKRYAKWGRRLLFAGLLLIVFQVVKVLYYSEPDPLKTFSEPEGDVYRSRTLKSGATWEQCDFEEGTSPYAFIPVYGLIVFLLFVALAIICDDFFVPSLEAISEKLDLSEDVAGATFMAAGSSAPELFTSVAGVGVESDVGIGTIVGSAMFNILIIVAMSAVLAGQVLNLDWRPLMRDVTVYGISIVLFIGFAWDGKLEWYEALTLLLMYILYIVLMKFNPYLMKLLTKVECAWCRNESRVEPEHTAEDSTSEDQESSSKHGDETGTHQEHKAHSHHHSSHSLHDEHKHRFVHSHRGELASSFANRRRSSVVPHSSTSTVQQQGEHGKVAFQEPHVIINPDPIHEGAQSSNSTGAGSQSVGSHLEEEEGSMVLIPCLPPIRTVPPDFQLAQEEGKWGITKYVLKWILFVFSFPFVVVFTWTIPNCSENRKWYVVVSSFCMSILWIAVISFVMVTCVTRVGCILNIGQFTMGLIVVAIGTSIPDALSSILVARDGFGDMAVSNAVGSNVFDINLGIGLPFLIRICIDRGEAFQLMSDEQLEAYNAGKYTIPPHAKFGFLLLIVLFMALGTFIALRFRMNSTTGLFLVIIYALFITYAFIQETVCESGEYC